MKVLFDISHPAHVHLFKHTITELQSECHKILVLSRNKDITLNLLDHYGIDHIPLSSMGSRKYSLISEWTKREIRTIRFAFSFQPDVVLSITSPPPAHAAWVSGCPNIVFNDSEPTRLAAKLTHPFSDRICTPANFNADYGAKHERYDGYHELAYLHPNRFQPNPKALEKYGINSNDVFSVVRFVSWGAHHDVGQRGFSMQAKRELVSVLSDYGDVYITSESPLPSEFEEYRLPIPPHLIHDFLYYANLYVGDSQTMATEAAILGTPSVRSNTFAGEGDMSNFVELESEYELLYSRSDESEAIEIVGELIADSGVKTRWQQKRDRLINDKIDVTDYILESVYELGENAS